MSPSLMREGSLVLVTYSHTAMRHLQDQMGSERGFNDELVGHVAFKKTELIVLGKALGLADRFISHIEGLVADDQLDGTIAPLNEFRVAYHLIAN